MQTFLDDGQLDVEAGLIELRQIPDEANDADVLTKIITGRPFRTKARRLLGSESVLDPM